MGLFGNKKKEDIYRIELIPLKTGFDSVAEMLSQAVFDAGQTLTEGIAIVQERGQTFALGRVNGDTEVSCFLIRMDDIECIVELKKPEASTTTEADISSIFLSFLEKYVKANWEIHPFNYIVCKGKNSKKLNNWGEVSGIVCNDGFIAAARSNQ